jgi:hypothetical protein
LTVCVNSLVNLKSRSRMIILGFFSRSLVCSMNQLVYSQTQAESGCCVASVMMASRVSRHRNTITYKSRMPSAVTDFTEGGTPRGFAMGVAFCANYPASQSILPHSQIVTMVLCREQLYLAPNHTMAGPSKTQGRPTQDIQSSIHPGRANPPRSAFQRAHSQRHEKSRLSFTEAMESQRLTDFDFLSGVFRRGIFQWNWGFSIVMDART